MKSCNECSKEMQEMSRMTPEGVKYNYFKCNSCGDEIVDMKQLHEVAEKYKSMRVYHAKINQWGQSLGLRIPKELVEKYHFKNNEEIKIIPEKHGIKIVSS